MVSRHRLYIRAAELIAQIFIMCHDSYHSRIVSAVLEPWYMHLPAIGHTQLFKSSSEFGVSRYTTCESYFFDIVFDHSVF